MDVKNKETIIKLFEKVDDLDNVDKSAIKRAYGIPFRELGWRQQAILYRLAGEYIYGRECDLLTDMMAIYIKQDCSNGKEFESLLAELYKNSSEAEKKRIGYMMDESDYLVRKNAVLKYLRRMAKKEPVDIVKLTYDILNWNSETKAEWTKAILGIKNENQINATEITVINNHEEKK